MKHKLLWLFLFIYTCSYTSESYISQIKVVDRCTLLTEVITAKSLGIRGVLYENFEHQKAIRACEKSFKEHPNDAHVKFLLSRAYSKASRYEEGFKLAKESCSAGDLGGCTLLGGYYNKGLYKNQRDDKKAYLLYMWSCTSGDPQACSNLSFFDYHNYVVKSSKERNDYLLQTCISGYYPPACSTYGYFSSYGGLGISKEQYEYANYKSCISGNKTGCMFLKMHLNKLMDKHRKEKIAYSQKLSCNSGNQEACGDLGNELSRKPKTRLNNLMTLALYEDGCNGGDTFSACRQAGLWKLSTEKGITQDIPLGIHYLEKSCYNSSNFSSCHDLANIHLNTPELEQIDERRGLKAVEMSCKLGSNAMGEFGCKHNIEICCKREKESKNYKMNIPHMENICNGSSIYACLDLAKFYLNTDEKEKRNIPRAKELIKKVCKSHIADERILNYGCDQEVKKCCLELKLFKSKK